jgi:predicted DCC family thiol-disulfide oxidoreductase YuxK
VAGTFAMVKMNIIQPWYRTDPCLAFPFYAVNRHATIRVMTANPDFNRPSSVKPTMLWDGECGFCSHWIRRWEKATGDTVHYRPYQEALSDFPQVAEEECKKAVQLVLADGRVFMGAHAVLKSLAIGGRSKWLLSWYEHSRIFHWFADSAYRFVAANRSWLPRI